MFRGETVTFRELEEIYTLQLKVKEREESFARIENGETGLEHSEIEIERRRLENMQSALYRELRKLGRFINGIDFPVIRSIVRLRYLKFLTWAEVARQLGDGSGSDCRRALRKYLKLRRLQEWQSEVE